MAKVRITRQSAGHGEGVHLFEVYNSAQRSLLVLATNSTEAVEIAHAANHLHVMWDRKDKSYPHAEVRNPTHVRQLAYHLDLIQRAIRKRLRGTVHVSDASLFVGSNKIEK